MKVVLLAAGSLSPELTRISASASPVGLSLGVTSVLELVISSLDPLETVYVVVGPESVADLSALLSHSGNAELMRLDRVSTSIGDTVYQVIEKIGTGEAIEIRYADSLIEWRRQIDSIAVSSEEWDDKWDYITIDMERRESYINRRPFVGSKPALVGAYTFSQPSLLHSLIRVSTAEEPFFDAVMSYQKEVNGHADLTFVEDWADFGHAETYIQERSRRIAGREFNDFIANGNWVEKSSVDGQKLEREFLWLANPLKGLEAYYPRVRGGSDSYFVEFFPEPNLGELMIFGDPSKERLSATLSNIEDWMSRSSDIELSCKASSRIPKITQDLRNVLNERLRITQDEFPRIITRQVRESALANLEEMLAGPMVSSHGDMVFSNLVATNSPRSNLTLIDPRGGVECFDDPLPVLYDWGKLAQCIFHHYDLATMGPLATRTVDDNWLDAAKNIGKEKFSILQKWFTDKCPNYELAINLGSVLLLTAAPLHRDNLIRFENLARLGSRGLSSWN